MRGVCVLGGGEQRESVCVCAYVVCVCVRVNVRV